MAQFKITKPDGMQYTIECDLKHAQMLQASHGSGTQLELLHPGTSGHGTAGYDF